MFSLLPLTSLSTTVLTASLLGSAAFYILMLKFSGILSLTSKSFNETLVF